VGELLEKFHIGVVRVAAEPSLWRILVRCGPRPSAAIMAAAQQFFAGQFRRRMVRQRAAHADVFFGTALAGRIEMQRLRAFFRSSFPPRCRLAEICFHPAEAAGAPAADDWRDPLAACRPRELELLVSGELAEYLFAGGARLGRLAALAEP